VLPFLWQKGQRNCQNDHPASCEEDIASLRLFCADYPQARGLLLYGGHQRYRFGQIDVVPLGVGLTELGVRLA
jgi:hypothetical protein